MPRPCCVPAHTWQSRSWQQHTKLNIMPLRLTQENCSDRKHPCIATQHPPTCADVAKLLLDAASSLQRLVGRHSGAPLPAPVGKQAESGCVQWSTCSSMCLLQVMQHATAHNIHPPALRRPARCAAQAARIHHHPPQQLLHVLRDVPPRQRHRANAAADDKAVHHWDDVGAAVPRVNHHTRQQAATLLCAGRGRRIARCIRMRHAARGRLLRDAQQAPLSNDPAKHRSAPPF